MTDQPEDRLETLRSWYWLFILAACASPILIGLYAADQHIRAQLGLGGDHPWDFNGDGSFTVSDIGAWWNRLSAYPAHGMLIEFAPRPAHFFELEKQPETGFWTSTFGLALWCYLAWLGWILVWGALSWLTQKLPENWRVKAME